MSAVGQGVAVVLAAQLYVYPPDGQDEAQALRQVQQGREVCVAPDAGGVVRQGGVIVGLQPRQGRPVELGLGREEVVTIVLWQGGRRVGARQLVAVVARQLQVERGLEPPVKDAFGEGGFQCPGVRPVLQGASRQGQSVFREVLFVHRGMSTVAVGQGQRGEKFIYRVFIFGVELPRGGGAEGHQAGGRGQRAVVGAAQVGAEVECLPRLPVEAAIKREFPVIVVLVAQVEGRMVEQVRLLCPEVVRPFDRHLHRGEQPSAFPLELGRQVGPEVRGVVGATGPLGREACLQAAAEAVALAQVAGRMAGVETPVGVVVALRGQGQGGR